MRLRLELPSDFRCQVRLIWLGVQLQRKEDDLALFIACANFQVPSQGGMSGVLKLLYFHIAKIPRARVAWAGFTQMVETVNPRGVPVGEFDLDGVAAYRRCTARSHLRLEQG